MVSPQYADLAGQERHLPLIKQRSSLFGRSLAVKSTAKPKLYGLWIPQPCLKARLLERSLSVQFLPNFVSRLELMGDVEATITGKHHIF